jgi:hypothetical protein
VLTAAESFPLRGRMAKIDGKSLEKADDESEKPTCIF